MKTEYIIEVYLFFTWDLSMQIWAYLPSACVMLVTPDGRDEPAALCYQTRTQCFLNAHLCV